jgi:hypothetical protein
VTISPERVRVAGATQFAFRDFAGQVIGAFGNRRRLPPSQDGRVRLSVSTTVGENWTRRGGPHSRTGRTSHRKNSHNESGVAIRGGPVVSCQRGGSCCRSRVTSTATRNAMKEILTKSFWQGVKKTFNEALKNPPSKDDGLRAPGNPDALSTPEPPPFSANREKPSSRCE